MVEKGSTNSGKAPPPFSGNARKKTFFLKGVLPLYTTHRYEHRHGDTKNKKKPQLYASKYRQTDGHTIEHKTTERRYPVDINTNEAITQSPKQVIEVGGEQGDYSKK